MVEPHVSPHISAVLFVILSVYMFLLCSARRLAKKGTRNLKTGYSCFCATDLLNKCGPHCPNFAFLKTF